LNILIVDEDNKDRRLLRAALERHGCMVIEAVDGLEGLHHTIHHQPDIIISNTLMPRMDGFQLLWALKSDPKLTSIPFLFFIQTPIRVNRKRNLPYRSAQPPLLSNRMTRMLSGSKPAQ